MHVATSTDCFSNMYITVVKCLLLCLQVDAGCHLVELGGAEQAGASVIKLFSPSLMVRINKLERLSLARLFIVT
jgi:hypothetical protein